MSAPVIGTALARLRLRALRSAAEPGVIATPIIAGDALSRVARAEGRPSVTLVVPSVTAAVFAGIHTAIEVAALVAKRRSLPMRVLTLDAPSRSSAARAARAIATSTGVEQSTVSVQSAWSTTTTAPGDVWITTYYATTLAVERACDRGAVDRDRVIMLVQDHEPSFFAASTEAVVAEAAYSAGFRTLVNSEPLRRYLTDCTEARGAVHERTFRPSVDIDALRQTAATRSRSDGAVRIGFYARPSRPRNAFGLGRAALQTAGERLRDGGIDFSVTTMGERHHPFDVAGRPVRVLGPLGWDDYFAELAQIDVLLSLQLTLIRPTRRSMPSSQEASR